jgi:hypothetical protein
MKHFIGTILILLFYQVNSEAQSLFEASTVLSVQENAVVYFGGDATIEGEIRNSGHIVANADLGFRGNRAVGNLDFIGLEDQRITGDTINTNDFLVDKEGLLFLDSRQVIVNGVIDIENGIIKALEDADLLLEGTTFSDGNGYVEGKVVGESRGIPIIFPVGVSNFTNYITITDQSSGNFIEVACRIPESSSLIPNNEIVGIADELEWLVWSISGPTEASVDIAFNGVDLFNFSNGAEINSRAYSPAIVVFDSLTGQYQPLDRFSVEAFDEADRSSGKIVSENLLTLSEQPIRLAIAWIPVLDGPTFYIPNAFAPNGTIEENRRFRVNFAGGAVTAIDFQVFDSFYKEVFKSVDSGSNLDLANYSWDGYLSNGSIAPGGIYYYQVNLKTDQGDFSQAGSVMLMK